MSEVELTEEEKERYLRHLIIDEVGEEGQKKIKAAKVLVVGAGGLGSPVSFYLTAAGVGTIGIVDFDTVSASNLQRQILYSTNDLGREKVVLAAEKLRALNPNVNVVPYNLKLTKENAEEIFRNYDMVLDGTDNFATRYIINEVCVKLEMPYFFGAIMRFSGQLTTIMPGVSPCLCCIYPELADEGTGPIGVFGIIPGIIGTLEATEALKYIMGIGDNLIGRMIMYDALAIEFRDIILERNPDCPVCGHLSL